MIYVDVKLCKITPVIKAPQVITKVATDSNNSNRKIRLRITSNNKTTFSSF